jgi:hypothetical protein
MTLYCLLELCLRGDTLDTYRCKICGGKIQTPSGTQPPKRHCLVERAAPCECPAPGFCKRHKIAKSASTHKICVNDPEQRAVWDYIAITGQSPFGEAPSLAKRIVNFSVASIRHFFSGEGTRTDEQIETILDICHTCPSGLFNGAYCESLKCGCFLNKKKHFSKIAWKSEHCPEGHW